MSPRRGAATGTPEPRPVGRGATGDVVAEAPPLRLELEALADFFGAGPAWSDPRQTRYRFRIDSAGGGWLEFYVAPAERLVSLRVADGAVHALHVDLTLDEVEAVVVEPTREAEARLVVVCGPGLGATRCRVSVTLRPDILVVLAYGRH